MKIRTISRSSREHTRQCTGDIRRVQRNPDPLHHPHERARELTRAVNAAKLGKVFAKPFVGALDGHCDTVYSLARSSKNIVALVSGAGDGEVRVWDIQHRRAVVRVPAAHRGIVRGLCVGHSGETFFSCGHDKTVKQFALAPSSAHRRRAAKATEAEEEEEEESDDPDDIDYGAAASGDARALAHLAAPEPLSVWTGTESFSDIDHHWHRPIFATAGTEIEVWDHDRSEPIHSFSWGSDSISALRFNPAEPCLIAAAGSDRGVALHDVRTAASLRKVILEQRTNALAWNPMEPMNFTCANEDHNCYTFDMRRLSSALKVHKDHIGPVMAVSYAPTGREFVTGSYDRTVRIFDARNGRSREMYHGRRMQRVFSVEFSADNSFVLSGSEDTNVRIWKARSNKKLGQEKPRERVANDYRGALLKRYKSVKEVHRIDRHRQVPRFIKKATKRKTEAHEKARRKKRNVEAHSAPGAVKHTAIRKEKVFREMS
jgi:WD repeat and SOF domain-containing protein 1